MAIVIRMHAQCSSHSYLRAHVNFNGHRAQIQLLLLLLASCSRSRARHGQLVWLLLHTHTHTHTATCTARTRWNTILICSFCGVQFYWYVVDMLGTLCRSRCLAHCCCECARRKKAMQCGCVRAHTLRNYHIKTANVAIYKFKQIRLCLSVSRMLDARRSRAPRVNFQTINSIGLEHTGHMGISLLWIP